MEKLFSCTKLILIIVVSGVFFASCIKHSELVSLNGDDREIKNPKGAFNSVVYDELHDYEAYKIQSFDQLMIKVNAFDGSTEEYLNREFSGGNTFSREINYDPPSLYFNSYYSKKNIGNIIKVLYNNLYIIPIEHCSCC